MNPAIMGNLASKVLAVLTPFAAKTAVDFVGVFGETAYEKTKELFGKLKAKWTGDKGNDVVLEKFQEQPEAFKPAVEALLTDTLNEDESFRGEVERLMKDIGPTLEIIQRMEKGENVTGLDVGEMKGGRASVTQEIKEGKNVTGAKIDKLG